MTLSDVKAINWDCNELEEALEVFDDNIEALTIAVSKLHKDQPNKIRRNIKLGRNDRYKSELIQILENNTKKDIKRYIALSQIDFAECYNTLKSVNEFLRLSDFKDSREFRIAKEIKTLEEIIVLANSTHAILSGIGGTPKAHTEHEGQQTFDF